MHRIGWICASGLLGLFLLGAGDPKPVLHFPADGFSIAPLERPADGRGMLLTMNLPATDGFGPNVNIVCQDSGGTLDGYIAISKQGMDVAGMQVIKTQKLDDQTAIIEYTGNIVGRALHFYAKVNVRGDKAILVTATATEKQWPTVSKSLVECVDSFQRDTANTKAE